MVVSSDFLSSKPTAGVFAGLYAITGWQNRHCALPVFEKCRDVSDEDETKFLMKK